MKGISNDLKKLVKYFNGTTTITFNLLTPAALQQLQLHYLII